MIIILHVLICVVNAINQNDIFKITVTQNHCYLYNRNVLDREYNGHATAKGLKDKQL